MMTTAAAAVVSRRRSPLAGAFFAPRDLTDLALLHAVTALAADLVSFDLSSFHLQRRNTRSLVRKIKVLVSLFESLRDSSSPARHGRPPASSVALCLKEFYIFVYRAKALLEYCAQSGRLWLLLRNDAVSSHFHDLEQELSTLLDVFPLKDIDVASDVKEHVELVREQCRRSKLFLDHNDESLRRKIQSFLHEFEAGTVPDSAELSATFVDRLGIRDAAACREEIELLEEQIYNQEEDSDLLVVSGVVALTRYCRFLLFGFQKEVDGRRRSKNGVTRYGPEEEEKSSVAMPKEFCCPISLDLMRDPVIASTGQTYDRASITRWIEEGHVTCPNSGQVLTHTDFVPNRALRNLMSQWCAANGLPYDFRESSDESVAIPTATKAVVEANRATVGILVRQLSDGSEDAKTIAAGELRLLAKIGGENRACIAEAGAIPLLHCLVCSSNPATQENSVTAMLNLSIHDENKGRIMEEDGCLRSIVEVLRRGWTTEARENAAATLFSLSVVHGYKKRIADEPEAAEALAALLIGGSSRGKKDAVMALFNLSTHAETGERMLDSGAVGALVCALRSEGVAEEAAGALALLVRQKVVAEVVGRDDAAVSSLVGLMRSGCPKAKENAVSALNAMCRSGGAALTERVARMPALGGLIQALLFTGTKRARRKAASLARMCHRCETSAPPEGRWGMEYALARTNSFRGAGGDVSVVSIPVAISVPAL